jgi:hypothetical protein
MTTAISRSLRHSWLITGATSGVGTAYHSKTPAFFPVGSLCFSVQCFADTICPIILFRLVIALSIRHWFALLILPLASSSFSYYIDILLELNKERGLKTKLFDKRDDITFPIVNFPFISNNILSVHFITRTLSGQRSPAGSNAIKVRLTYS